MRRRRVTPLHRPDPRRGHACDRLLLRFATNVQRVHDRLRDLVKRADTFSPFGPCVTTDLDYGNLQLTTRLNGNTVQDTSTSDLIYGVDSLVSFFSQHMTLEPGDAIFTGTSGSSEAMKAGDVCEVELEGCGILSTPLADEA